MKIEVQTDGNKVTCYTVGLCSTYGYELSATVHAGSLQAECADLVLHVAERVTSGDSIGPGTILNYGSCVMKMNADPVGRLAFCELNPETGASVFWVDSVLTHWRDQHEMCEKVGAKFSAPALDQLIVISEGVYEGEDVEGVRYPSPEHMTGWWLTTDRFNGDISTLVTVHAHHVTAARPDLVKYLALPFGYRFFSPTSEVWFDQKVSDATP